MPLRVNGHSRIEDMTVQSRQEIDHKFQAHWYRHIGQFVSGKTVLDAGAGTGYGLGIMAAYGAIVVEGFDPLPSGPTVRYGYITDYPSDSWDIVVAMDVIEHIEDDIGFFANLLRVCKDFVFISTPNWNVSKAKNEFHVREYTPTELLVLLGEHRKAIWVSNHLLEITTRDRFEPDETWHNFGVMVWK